MEEYSISWTIHGKVATPDSVGDVTSEFGSFRPRASGSLKRLHGPGILKTHAPGHISGCSCSLLNGWKKFPVPGGRRKATAT